MLKRHFRRESTAVQWTSDQVLQSRSSKGRADVRVKRLSIVGNEGQSSEQSPMSSPSQRLVTLFPAASSFLRQKEGKCERIRRREEKTATRAAQKTAILTLHLLLQSFCSPDCTPKHRNLDSLLGFQCQGTVLSACCTTSLRHEPYALLITLSERVLRQLIHS